VNRGVALARAEPLVHSHVTDGLPPAHPLARTRVYCDRCGALLHMQTNSCMRTWMETGLGNFCVRCFIVAAGGLAPDETRLAGVDCLTPGWSPDPMAGEPQEGKAVINAEGSEEP